MPLVNSVYKNIIKLISAIVSLATECHNLMIRNTPVYQQQSDIFQCLAIDTDEDLYMIVASAG